MSEQLNLRSGRRILQARISKLFVACLAAPMVLFSNVYADSTQVFHAEAINFSSSVTTRSDGPLLLSISAFNRQFDLALSPNSDLIENVDASDLAGVNIYKGTIVGVENSWVRLTQIGDQTVGVIHDGTEMFLIDSISEMGGAVSLALEEELQESGAVSAMFRANDVVMSDICAVDISHSNIVDEGESLGSLVSEFDAMASNAQAAAPDKAIRVAYMYDDALESFASARGTTAKAQSLIHLNIVDGIFSNQVGVKLLLNGGERISGSGNINSSTLLEEFRQFVIQRGNPGIAHLFTGRELDSSVAGIAYVGAICSANYGVGLSEVGKNSRLPVIGGLIAAHEVGHNFGAPHDNQSGACASTPGNFLMNPSINGSDQFSSCSLTQMASRIASSGGCLVPYNGGGNNAPQLDSIGNQSNKVGDTVNLRATASDQDNDSLTFSATRLPAGLRMSSAGVISGQVTTAGTYQTVVSVSDGQASDSESLSWTVTGVQQPLTISLAASSLRVKEEDSSLPVVVRLSRAATSPVSVSVFTRSGTATTGKDFYGFGITMTFAPGETSKQTSVDIVDDSEVESTENFTVRLLDPSEGQIAISPMTINILDDDSGSGAPGYFGIKSTSVNENAGSARVTVSLSKPLTTATSIEVATSAGTAKNSTDFFGVYEIVKFAAGETSKTVAVTILDDTSIERQESFNIRIFNPTGGARIGEGSATINITDND